MKLVAIGDIHGRNIWQQIVEQEQPNTVVFVGDYFDSHDTPGVDQMYNFKNIIQWKLDNPQCKVIMLVGNHDYHYMPECRNETYSGFQEVLYFEIARLLEENRHHLQMAFKYDDLVFSHAGVSPEFLLDNNWGDQDMVEFINDLWYFRPHKFRFAHSEYEYSDQYGDNTFQSPLWIRPKSLMKACQDIKKTMIQVVGHTEVKEIDPGKATGGRYYFIDCLGTSQEYLVYENKQIKINKL
jgi:hypothetical protein